MGVKIVVVKTHAVSGLLSAMLVLMAVCSCTKQAPQAGIDPRAFDSAPPDIKQEWDKALAEAAQNDFGAAITTLRTLSRHGLSPELGKTAYDAIVVYEGKLREAARKGDAAAVKAMQGLGISTNPAAP